jgi:ppGpp synthetase/RelA/SpoT-type nucleotidyltranferase
MIFSLLSLPVTTATLPSGRPDVALSQELGRQARHIGFEFMRLKEIRYQANGPESGSCDTTQEAVTERVNELFADLLGRGADEEHIVEEAKLVADTLREVRTLHDKEHFFSKPMRTFYRHLTILSTDYDQFGLQLFQELYHYRRQRDEDERKFLEPFAGYLTELRTIIENISNGFPFKHFEIEVRIKRDLLSKMRKRVEEEGWEGMREKFFDLLGLRIIVGSQAGVDAAVALVEGAMKLHEAAMRSQPGCPHYFQVDHVEDKNNDRGYRAKHINVRRACNNKNKTYATAEIQVMSRGIRDWGKPQRLLVYKDDSIPENVKDELKVYCRQAADFIVQTEESRVEEKPPQFDIMILNRIADDKLRSDVLDRVADMDQVMNEYRQASLV